MPVAEYDDATSLIKSISQAITPRSCTVSELLRNSQTNRVVGQGSGREDPDNEGVEHMRGCVEETWLSTGDTGLDGLLGGGVRIGTVTEIAGESASGKSHLAMSLALCAQLPPSTQPGGTIILTSERDLATGRLVQLAQSLLFHHTASSPSPPTESLPSVRDLLGNIRTMRIAEISDLEHCLTYQIPALLSSLLPANRSSLLGPSPTPLNQSLPSETTINAPAPSVTVIASDPPIMTAPTVPVQPIPPQSTIAVHTSGKLPVKLIVLDSITALMRGTDVRSVSAIGLAQRSRYLCSVADSLKALAVAYNLAVVVINQVSDVFSRLPISTFTSSPVSQSVMEEDAPPMLYATQKRWFSGESDLLGKEASLGIVWANAVNTRIMLSRTGRRRLLNQEHPSQGKKGDGSQMEDIRPTLVRRAHLVFGPFAPEGMMDYVITEQGIRTLEGSFRNVGMERRRERSKRDKQGLSRTEEEVEIKEVEPGEKEVLDDMGELPPGFWDETPSSPVKEL
ncbi:hypothetical protein TREMEDRAFT_63698 [Tremella mesenterica DSM 1558]|uniref:uncharacterized protein n=1 Tax=Tremella mesenterica (strain ATCC 24925 / CBS 8224 / DSM 1558 / NBRC 9311 / NRRL Y-6157 / RJB 2259-6 / UBC 559-6) TaxID=578456 RepID=UPI0003F49F07|nr:uncharacterized protein TREMEDRAFT_63698 [Tremella mesenterica DSM 1558]EIW67807.1 hypothetical protein TREMEDRAFT_63698 [Tremella mesenterica DSM 1558]